MIKNIENRLALIEKWLRNKNTIEFLSIREEMYNPNFNFPEFEGIKNEVGLNRFILSMNDAIKQNLISAEITLKQASIIYASEANVLNVAMFGITVKQWREVNPEQKGNFRDYATINELICLSTF